MAVFAQTRPAWHVPIASPTTCVTPAAVAPSINTNADVTFGSQTTNTSIEGVTPEYESVRNEAVTEGEFINQAHMNSKNKVLFQQKK